MKYPWFEFYEKKDDKGNLISDDNTNLRIIKKYFASVYLEDMANMPPERDIFEDPENFV